MVYASGSQPGYTVESAVELKIIHIYINLYKIVYIFIFHIYINVININIIFLYTFINIILLY